MGHVEMKILTTKSGFELKGQFNMGCQWRVICVKV